MAQLVSQGICILSSSRYCYVIFDGIDPITRISEDREFVKVFMQVLMRNCREEGMCDHDWDHDLSHDSFSVFTSELSSLR
ncbi:871_t:CDS:2, partial [Acaulospora morrowiae]